MFVDSINVFDCHLSGVPMLKLSLIFVSVIILLGAAVIFKSISKITSDKFGRLTLSLQVATFVTC